MNLAILTYTLKNYSDIKRMISPNRDEYCAKHNYQHINFVGPYTQIDWYYAFDRLKLIYDIFFNETEYKNIDTIWCLNAQSVITNFNIPVESYLDNNNDFYMTHDCHVVNMGSFIIKKSEWSKKWLEFILSEEPKYHNDCWQENRVVIHHWEKPEWKEKIKLLPQNAINSYKYTLYPPWNETTPGHWKSGDLCISFPGTNAEQRKNLIKEVLERDVIK